MKLRKQAPAKALIVAASAGLLVLFYGVVKSEPRIKAAESTAAPAVDYQRFFAPSAPVGVPQPIQPRARTRAS